MSVTSGVVYRLNIDYLYQEKVTLMGPMALMELNYVIYDGLEMKLKVTKMLHRVQINVLWCK